MTHRTACRQTFRSTRMTQSRCRGAVLCWPAWRFPSRHAHLPRLPRRSRLAQAKVTRLVERADQANAAFMRG
jgi:hypothetical protein